MTLPRNRFPTVTKSIEFEFRLPQGVRTFGALEQVVSLKIFGVGANATDSIVWNPFSPAV